MLKTTAKKLWNREDVQFIAHAGTLLLLLIAVRPIFIPHNASSDLRGTKYLLGDTQERLPSSPPWSATLRPRRTSIADSLRANRNHFTDWHQTSMEPLGERNRFAEPDHDPIDHARVGLIHLRLQHLS